MTSFFPLRFLSCLMLLELIIHNGHGQLQAEELNQPPEGFVALFNGSDLTGWKGFVGDPKKRAAMSQAELADAQATADLSMRTHWSVKNGILIFDGKGKSLCTAKDYGDFAFYVDWKIKKSGDSGIYLRGSPAGPNLGPCATRDWLGRSLQQPKASEPTNRQSRQSNRQMEHVFYQDDR